MTRANDIDGGGGAVAGDVPSPCISLCVLLEAQGLCIGCLRTVDEIAEWSLLDAAGKRTVLAELPARRAALDDRRRNGG